MLQEGSPTTSLSSRLAITQARALHSGNYSCSLSPGPLVARVRIHILEGEKIFQSISPLVLSPDENQAFIASRGDKRSQGLVTIGLLFLMKAV